MTDLNACLVADGFRFTECPRWHDGFLYFVDIYDNRVCRLASSGKVQTVVSIDHPAGLGWLPGGDLIVAASHERLVYRHNDKGSRIFADLNGRGLSILNDMLVSPQGDAYLGSLGGGFERGELPPVPLLHLRADGAVSEAIADPLYGPNGMAILPDGRTLVVAESFASRLTAFDIGPEGKLRNRRTWAAFGEQIHTTVSSALMSSEPVPDGIAVDAEGAIWVADARGGGALRVAEGGRVLSRITFGGETAVAVALGGPEGKTLYAMVGPPFAKMAEVFASTHRWYSVYACPVSVPGLG